MTDQTISASYGQWIGSLRSVSTFAGDYILRIAITGIVLMEGIKKFPNLEAGAAGFRVPVELWTLAAIGEVVGPLALLVGGLMRNQIGDFITRFGGFLLAIIVAAVLLQVYWGPWILMRFHVLMMCVGLFFLLRGNPSRTHAA